MMKKTQEAFEVIKQAMIDDEPSIGGSYAHSWHCNIAMMCYDAMVDSKTVTADSNNAFHLAANDAATRFMKLCFDVETKQ